LEAKKKKRTVTESLSLITVRERKREPKNMASDRQHRRSNAQLVDRKSVKYNRSKNTYYLEIFYFNRGNSKRFRASCNYTIIIVLFFPKIVGEYIFCTKPHKFTVFSKYLREKNGRIIERESEVHGGLARSRLQRRVKIE
jgi:hypothetical protein